MLVFITAPDPDAAKSLARQLVAERLAACVNVLPGLTSIYRWQEKVEEASEVLLLAKTTRDRMPALTQRVQELHSYEVPEIIATEIAQGSVPYLDWVHKETTP